MRISIVGGTGKLGSGLAIRFGRAGHEVLVGSRSEDKARAHAADLAAKGHGAITGGGNEWATREGEIVILTVPYAAHGDTARAIAGAARGKIVVDATVPLTPPKVSVVHVPPGRAAALEAQAILGAETPVAAAFHHVSAAHLADPGHALACDVLVAADDARAKTAAMALVKELGVRALDAGALANAVALESLTPVLIHLNRTYKSKGSGVVFTDLPGGDGPR